MADDGLREIQLRGKHLVSLFMASAFLLVATFLCGVLVGRGVRAQKEPAMTPASAASGAVADDPTAPLVPLQPLTKTSPASPATTPPPPTEEDLSYYRTLEGKSASPASAKPATGAARAETPTRPTSLAPRQAAVPVATPAAPIPKPAAKTTTAPPPQKAAAAPPKTAAPSSAQKPAAASAAKPAEVAAGADPAGSGFVVKIVAYRDKAQSEALAARLVRKGYTAYVVTVTGKGAPLYSVRVGKFKARTDADAAKRRLEKEEQFKPLITR
jgi:cell division protein FtsN